LIQWLANVCAHPRSVLPTNIGTLTHAHANANLKTVSKDSTGTQNSVNVFVKSKNALMANFGSNPSVDASVTIQKFARPVSSGIFSRANVIANHNSVQLDFSGIQSSAVVFVKRNNVLLATSGISINAIAFACLNNARLVRSGVSLNAIACANPKSVPQVLSGTKISVHAFAMRFPALSVIITMRIFASAFVSQPFARMDGTGTPIPVIVNVLQKSALLTSTGTRKSVNVFASPFTTAHQTISGIQSLAFVTASQNIACLMNSGARKIALASVSNRIAMQATTGTSTPADANVL